MTKRHILDFLRKSLLGLTIIAVALFVIFAVFFCIGCVYPGSFGVNAGAMFILGVGRVLITAIVLGVGYGVYGIVEECILDKYTITIKRKEDEPIVGD